MLARLRRRFRSIKGVFRGQSRSTGSNRVNGTGLEENLHRFDWAGLAVLAEALDGDVQASQPLASAVARLSICINKLETYTQVPSGYDKIRTNMDDLFLELAGLLGNSESCTLKHGRAANLARSMEKETEPLLRLGETWVDVDTRDIKNQASEVLRHFRRLQTLMGYFIVAENVRIVDESTPDVVLDRLPHSSAVVYRSPDWNTIPRISCTKNTRVDILHEIKDWIRYENNQRVYWLSGMAGSGKTTVAYTLCDNLENSGYPTASYFCARRLSACRQASLILPEVSYQLSLLSRPFLCALHDTIDQEVAVQDWPIHDQFEHLIAMPLRRVGHAFPAHPVAVIDALDECEDRGKVNDLLKTLLTQATKLPIKFVLTSRQEAGAIDCMESVKIGQRLTERSLDKVFHLSIQEDIRTYLASELQTLDISPNELESLVEQSGGLFRHAACSVDYVLGKDRSQARERMLQLLDVFWDREGGGQADAIYETILDAMLSKNFHKDEELADIKLVLLTVISARVPITVDFLASFLAELPNFGLAMPLESALQVLHPVLQVSWMDGLITSGYKSLQRYMLEQHSGKHRCDANQDYITQLTLHCFRLIQSTYPSYNICNLPSSYLRDGTVPDIDRRVDDKIPHHLLDACRQWGIYIEFSPLCDQLVGALYEFLSSRLLLWMEVLNLKGCMRDGLEQLRKACAWMKV
ncbi:hypothetical protein FRC12_017568 [Ceratobasidium sp. 428]|nr:hypothetical protein FRC12_017568 [Ceratobasidium sp. 428]